jgi:hypothetical protein
LSDGSLATSIFSSYGVNPMLVDGLEPLKHELTGLYAQH